MTWTNLLWVVVALTVLYVVFVTLRRLIRNFLLTGKVRRVVNKALDRFLILYEPISIVIFFSVFILIRPVLHGIILFFLIIFALKYVTNYFYGRLVMAEGLLKEGLRVEFEGRQGIITKMGRFGTEVRSDNGLHYLPYNKLVTNGYLLAAGKEVGGYFHISVQLPEDKEERLSFRLLSDLLISSPYIDVDHKPEISRSMSGDRSIAVKLLVKAEDHIHDLIAYLEENGYVSTITKSK